MNTRLAMPTPNIPSPDEFALQMTQPNTRIKDGFMQYRVDGRWVFWISAFEGCAPGQPGRCSCVAADQSRQPVAIDGKDRILIGGKWYSRKHWIH